MGAPISEWQDVSFETRILVRFRYVDVFGHGPG